MKEKLSLSAVIILLCQFSFAQQKISSPLLKKSNHYKKQIIQGVKSNEKTSNLPSVNSFWKPGKMIESRWDTVISAWVFNDSVIYSYNTNGDVTLELYYNSYGPLFQTIYTYNVNAKLTQRLVQTWTGVSWDNNSRETYQYDANNNMTQRLTQNWNSGTSSWDNSFQSFYTYDANNNQTQYISQTWNGNSWDNSWKEDDLYNMNNQLIQMISQNWNSTTSSWENSWKEDLTYNGSGVLISATDYMWNGASWDNDVKIINIVWYQWTGDLNTSLWQSLLLQGWINNTWQDAYRYTTTYDAQGNITDFLSEEWQTSTWVIDYQAKDIYTYDTNNNIIQDIYQNWVPWLMTVRNDRRYDYSNYNLYSSVDDILDYGTINIYPNPSSNGQFKISGLKPAVYDLEVYNLFGESIFETTVNYKQEFFTLNVPNGIYFLRFKSGKVVISGRAVMQK